MVTYEQIFEAFCRYAASRDQSDWCDLWILCTRRMEALVKTKAKALKEPLSSEDIADLVTDSTILVMRKLRDANDIDAEIISKTFWYGNRTAFKTFNRLKRKIARDEDVVQTINEKYFATCPSNRPLLYMRGK